MRITHALFDFDGTISTIRDGWFDIMLQFEMGVVAPWAYYAPEKVQAILAEDIKNLTGQPTMFQMIQLQQRVKEWGGEPQTPQTYKAQFLERLNAHIQARLDSLHRAGLPERYMIPGAREFLDRLFELNIKMILFSGTDTDNVKEEARLLQVDHLFESIHGASSDIVGSSKRKVVHDLIASGVDPCRMISFGDGFVEIEEVVKVGGFGVGIASREKEPGMDPWKVQRLTEAGACCIHADFTTVASDFFKIYSQPVPG